MSFLFNSPRYQELHKAHCERVDKLLQSTEDPDQTFTISRCKGIGGSDVAKLLNKSPWGTPFTLWQDKTLRSENYGSADNVFTHWGTILENPIKKEYMESIGQLYGNEILENVSYTDEELPVIHANIDGIILRNNKPVRIVEIKTAMLNSSSGQFNEFGQSILSWGDGNIYQTDDSGVIGVAQEDHQVPYPYYLQVQLYMLAMKIDVADIAVLIGHHDFRVFTIHADKEIQQEILDKIDEFWCKNVLDDTPPELVAADLDTKQSSVSKVVATADDLSLYSRLIEIKNKSKVLSAEKEEIENKLKERIGLNDMLTDSKGKPLCTYKTSAARKSFDTTRFKKENSEMYAKYLKENEPTRRFMVKEPKDE